MSLEALYMFEHKEIIPDPVGTYFSTNDIATPGGTYVMLGFGAPDQPVINPDLYYTVCKEGNYSASDQNLPPELIGAGCGAAVGRVDDVKAKDSGQYGVALRWFAEDWNATEFGFYFLNYHSRLPVLSGVAITTSVAQQRQVLHRVPRGHPAVRRQLQLQYRNLGVVRRSQLPAQCTACRPMTWNCCSPR